MRRFTFLIASVLSLVACASEPRRPPVAMDPSNPEAPEAPLTEPSATLAGQEAPGFTCPMHPEVHTDAPGRCPKCGMKLVPRKPEGKTPTDAGTPEADEASHHHHGHGAHR